ncbi:LacI family DNA-binding transcriptional regulator [Clostridium sp. MCC353]|uniref:LacI family DNA-binding transcriptional regulator n=1 Tax=Clostridium sp. MCC353 TaxID=2592646 RepID=UPI001C011A16|nr:LacI family DNA-binding transcriptional regulator [Clostridium sp. MCC353]MBT9779681.1 LacI family DNA-binding transcriptional regulator [Clostridium sp. MCC353]
MRPTLYEIAQTAGVSISTVSRVLNNDKQKPASPATAEKVLQIARELGYINDAGVSKNQTKSLVCILVSPSDSFNNYFFSQILMGIQEESKRLGYELKQTISTSTADIYPILNSLNNQDFDGIILLGRLTRDIMDRFKQITGNIIYAGLNSPQADIDEIICDAYTATASATEYFINCGFKTIGFIGTIPSQETDVINEHRFKAFCDTLSSHSFPLDMACCRNIMLTADHAYEAVKDLISCKKLPEGIICADDYPAIGAISALHDYGYKIPQDISIIGLADIDIAQFISPRLTTVRVVKRELGEFAVKILDDRIAGRHTHPIRVEFPCELIIRESSAARPKE